MARKRRSNNGRHGPSCPCQTCDERWPETGTVPSSRWEPASSQPPQVGTIAGTDHLASFKTTTDGSESLIADGDFSDDNEGFAGPRGKRHHNHYGAPDGDHDRGKYTGPGR